ncbi:MAG: glycogen synthase [Myxococcales bacterium]|nr:glycogen synthase [Myxococcales bacterium]
MPRLKVLFVVSECVPLVKTGGLGDVAGVLPQALAARGHDVRVIMPRYRSATAYPAERRPEPLVAPLGGGERWCGLWEGRLEGDVPIYLLEHDVLYDRDGLYGDTFGEFGDNLLRYALLSRASLELPAAIGWEPDVFHVHDWQSALVPVYQRVLGRPATSVLTIHNLGYQGRFGREAADALGIDPGAYGWLGLECFGDVNLLQAGITCATALSTVSPRYAQEIQTPLGGAGLDGALAARGRDLVGVLNGIDEEIWDPRSDLHIAERFGVDDLDRGKAACKAALQLELGLPVRPEVPLVGLVSRFAWQKGIDIFARAVEMLHGEDIQFAVLGSGESWAEELFGRWDDELPHFAARCRFDEGLAHRIEAGADLFAMPSRYEPCGLNQMYSQRYGTLPVVRAVGGLADTVEDGVTGYVFEALEPAALVEALLRGAWVMRHAPHEHREMQRRSMQEHRGWDRAAAQYDALYRLASRRR